MDKVQGKSGQGGETIPARADGASDQDSAVVTPKQVKTDPSVEFAANDPAQAIAQDADGSAQRDPNADNLTGETPALLAQTPSVPTQASITDTALAQADGRDGRSAVPVKADLGADGAKSGTDRKADAPVTLPGDGKAAPTADGAPADTEVRTGRAGADLVPGSARSDRAAEVLAKLAAGESPSRAESAGAETAGPDLARAGRAEAGPPQPGASAASLVSFSAGSPDGAAPGQIDTVKSATLASAGMSSEPVAAKAADSAAPDSKAVQMQTSAEAALAPLKDAQPASERAPGEVLRGDIRAARASATGAEAARAASQAKSASAAPGSEIKLNAPSAGGAVGSPSPAAANPVTPPAFQALPAFEVLLAQMTGNQAADLTLGDAPVDPTLSKTEALFDPSGARIEARAEMRAASTLQFAQGPRMTPQSAQSMAAQIAQRFNEGSRVFDIRMDPPELGRVEVRMEVSSDNSVRAVLSAERAETLAELQRNARELERALTEAGLDVGEDALSFTLSDDTAAEDQAGGETATPEPVFADGETGAEALSGRLAPISTYGFLLSRAEGLDVSV
jgi:flagellar hook-length control protein FliK